MENSGRTWYLRVLTLLLLSCDFITCYKEEVRISDWSKIEAELDQWLQCRPFDRCNATGRPPSTTVAPSLMSRDDFMQSACFCDEDCFIYGDCCLDAAVTAWNSGKNSEIDIWKCDKVMGINEIIYMVGRCPPAWKDKSVDLKCQRKLGADYSYILDIPAFSNRTKRIYRNAYCAFCHHDADTLLRIELHYACPKNDIRNCERLSQEIKFYPGVGWKVNNTKLHVQLRLADDQNSRSNILQSINFPTRRCRGTVTKKCESKDKTNPMDEYYCKLFASYVSNDDIVQYNNHFCARCSDISPKHLNCNINITGYGTGIAETPGISFALIFDFNFVGGEVSVGRKRRCSKGELFDPNVGQCVVFACGHAFAHAGEDKCLDIASEILDPTNSSCPWVLRHRYEFEHFENGSIREWKSHRQFDPQEYEQINETSIVLCEKLELLMDKATQYISKFSALQTRISTVCLCISIFCLAFHILIHGCVSKLRNLPGKNLLSLASMLFIAQLLFLGVNRIASPDSNELSVKNLCRFVAITLHFSFLSSFFWMNVMAVDICRIFTAFRQRSMSTGEQNYRRYAYYAWGFPALIVICAFIIDVSNDFLQEISPNYGAHNICWIMNRKGLLVFFVLPVSIILIENIVFFSLTAREIYRTKRAVQNIQSTDKDRVRFVLYTKLAFIMGLSWILGFVASFAEVEPLWYAFIILNGLQGAFIFLFFTLKKKVILAFRDHFCRQYRRKDRTKKRHRSRSRDRMEGQKLRMCSSATNLTALASGTSSNLSDC